MKQNDSETRLVTAELMQAFSGGVCFQYPRRLQILELRQVLLRYVLGDAAPDLKEWIWTKVGYVSGELLPSNKAFSEEHNNLIRKVSIDGMWSLPLEHLAESAPEEFSDNAERILATATNTDAAWYREEKLPFDEVLAREQGYFVSLLLDDLRQIIREIWRDYPEHRDASKLPSTDWINPDSIVWTQPSIRVLAGVNAALMVSSKKFKINDLLDFQHAALAVPYCDALFCDHPMAHALINKPLEFAKVYETTILSQPDEIKNYLQNLR